MDGKHDVDIDKLNLTEQEQIGVEKFLNAYNSIQDDAEVLSMDDDYVSFEEPRGITEQQRYSLVHTMEEFLSAFSLVGFDLSGNKVEIVSYPNELTYHALVSGVQQNFQSWMMSSQIPQPPPEDENYGE